MGGVVYLIYNYFSTKTKFLMKNKFSNRPASYQKLSYIQKVSLINRKLRTGDITRVAEETGYSTTHVSDVISGKYFNDLLVNRAYDMTLGRVSNVKKINTLSSTPLI